MRARMALDAAGVAVEHREVILRDKPQAMLDASPKGTVPVLVLPDGQVIEESLDVMDWALARNDPDGWLSPQDRSDAEGFLATFKDALDRYKYASRYDETRARGDTDPEQRDVAFEALLDLAAPLHTTAFLRGDRPRYLDIATFPFVRQFAAVEPDWWTALAPEKLQRWLAALINSERFQRIMAKHPVWTS